MKDTKVTIGDGHGEIYITFGDKTYHIDLDQNYTAKDLMKMYRDLGYQVKYEEIY